MATKDPRTKDLWGAVRRRSAKRWQRLAPEIAEATGWEIWNPGIYGEKWHACLRASYPPAAHPVVAFGLNPGPYGMAQTGVPFTDVKRLVACLPELAAAIERKGGTLEVPGLAPKSLQRYLTRTFESSSVRVYKFLEHAYGTAGAGLSRFVLANPCPLLFIDPATGKNQTPADLKRAARANGAPDPAAILEKHDRLRWECAVEMLDCLQPSAVVLLGRNVQGVMGEALAERGQRVVDFMHPARAIPDKWAHGLVDALRDAGVL